MPSISRALLLWLLKLSKTASFCLLLGLLLWFAQAQSDYTEHSFLAFQISFLAEQQHGVQVCCHVPQSGAAWAAQSPRPPPSSTPATGCWSRMVSTRKPMNSTDAAASKRGKLWVSASYGLFLSKHWPGTPSAGRLNCVDAHEPAVAGHG